MPTKGHCAPSRHGVAYDGHTNGSSSARGAAEQEEDDDEDDDEEEDDEDEDDEEEDGASAADQLGTAHGRREAAAAEGRQLLPASPASSSSSSPSSSSSSLLGGPLALDFFRFARPPSPSPSWAAERITIREESRRGWEYARQCTSPNDVPMRGQSAPSAQGGRRGERPDDEEEDEEEEGDEDEGDEEGLTRSIASIFGVRQQGATFPATTPPQLATVGIWQRKVRPSFTHSERRKSTAPDKVQKVRGESCDIAILQ